LNTGPLQGQEVLRRVPALVQNQAAFIESLQQIGIAAHKLENELGREGFDQWASAQGIEPRICVFWRYVCKATDAELADSILRLADWLNAQSARMLDAKGETAVQKLNRLHAEAQEASRMIFCRKADAGHLLAAITAEVGAENMPDWLAANFSGTDADAAEYSLTASVSPALRDRINAIHGAMLAQAIREAINPQEQP
jgi:hypothetical protein